MNHFGKLLLDPLVETAALVDFIQKKCSKKPLQKGFKSQLGGLVDALCGSLDAAHWKKIADLTQEALNDNFEQNEVAQNWVHFAAFLSELALESGSFVQNFLPLLINLHDSLLSLDSTHFLTLQEVIAHSCDLAYHKNVDGKEQVAPQMICFYLMRSLAPEATAADVKRVYSSRELLRFFDYQDDSSESMKELILYCFLSPVYLKNPDGIKFLAFTFSLDPTFLEQIHETMKNQIPMVSKQMVDVFGDIYFRAWKNAEEPFLSRIEYVCIQDLMNHGVHAAFSTFKNSAPQKIRKILDHFHDNKKQPGVDEMLCRLYEPIIWRSLNAANPLVRKNAATLLIDAFPIQDPSAPSEETDSLLQKQFNILTALLKDSCPQVRCVAVQGLCRIFAVFWELIPPAVISDILNVIVHELAFDSASSEVRCAVINGLQFLLENNALCHLALKKYLPCVGKLVHDTCHKNRVAFFDLLLAVKEIPDIKFWDVVDIAHLLYRLENDQPDVCKRASSVLINSFFPMKKDASIKITRCLLLLEKSPAASRKFYSCLPKYASLDKVCQFIVALYESLHLSLTGGKTEPVKKGKSRKSKNEDDEDDNEKSKEEFFASIEENFDSLLDIVAILLEKMIPELSKPKNKKMREAVVTSFENYPLSNLLTRTQTKIGLSAIFYIARHALATNFVDLSERCQEEIQKGNRVTPTQECMLDCLVAWGLGEQVFELFITCLENGQSEKTKIKSKTSKKKRASDASVDDEQRVSDLELLSLDYLQHIMKNTHLRSLLLSSPSSIDRLGSVLETIFTEFSAAISATASISPKLDYQVQCVELLFQLCVHRAAIDPSAAEMVQQMVEQLVECARSPYLQSNSEKANRSKSGGKRALSNSFSFSNISRSIIGMVVESAMLGFYSVKTLSLTSEMFASLLDSLNFASELVINGCRFMRQLVELLPAESEIEAKEEIANQLILMSELLLKKCTEFSDRSDDDEMKKTYSIMKQTLVDLSNWLPTDQLKIVCRNITRCVLKSPFDMEEDLLVKKLDVVLDDVADFLVTICQKDTEVSKMVTDDLFSALERCMNENDDMSNALVERIIVMLIQSSKNSSQRTKRTHQRLVSFMNEHKENEFFVKRGEAVSQLIAS